MGAKKNFDELAVIRAPRHPDLDLYWDLHHRFLWWWANRLSKYFNLKWFNTLRTPRSKHGRRRWLPEDFMGYLVIRLNYVLRWYDPSRNFTTFFSTNIVGDAWRMVIRQDAEKTSLNYSKKMASLEEWKDSYKNREFYESDFFMYRVPENESWAEEMVDLLGGGDQSAAWNKITEGLSPRAKTILEMRFKHGNTLQDCAVQFGITKERIRQVEAQSLASLRHRLEKLEPVRRLFYG